MNDECQRRENWPKWKDVIQVELDSLTKRKDFGPEMPTPPNIKLVDINRSSLDSVMRKRDDNLALWSKASHKTPWNRPREDILS